MSATAPADVTIRPAEPADMDAIAAMVVALNRHHDDPTEPSASAMHHLLFELPHGAECYLAEARGAAIGYAVIQPYLHLHFGAWGGEVHHLYVDGDWRGKGVGRMLAAAARKSLEAKGARYLRIKTDPSNQAAQKAYEAMGFTRRAPGPVFTMAIGAAGVDEAAP